MKMWFILACLLVPCQVFGGGMAKKKKIKPKPQQEELLTRAQVVHVPFITSSDLTVQSPSTRQNKFTVAATSGNTKINGNLTVLGQARMDGTNISNLAVTGSANINGRLGVEGSVTLAAVTADSLIVKGNTNIDGRFNLDGSATLAGVTAGSLAVTGNTTVDGTLGVTGPATLGSTAASSLNVSGSATVTGALTANGGITEKGDLAIKDASNATKFNVASSSGNTTVAGTLGVTGATTLAGVTAGSLAVTGNTTVDGTLGVTGPATLGSTAASSLNVSGVATVTGALTANGGITEKGDLAIKDASNTTKFAVASSSGNTTVAGTLGVTGATSLTGNTTMGGNLGVTGTTNLNRVAMSNLSVTDSTLIGGTFGVIGATTLDDVTVNGNLDLNGKVSLTGGFNNHGTTILDGAVIVNDGLLIGQKMLTDNFSTTTQTLLQLILPDEPNYIGLVNLTYMANITQGKDALHLEVFTAKYLVSRMDVTMTATVARIEESYFNEAGSIEVPESTGSEYAKALDCEYDSQWTSGKDTRVINFRYLPPTMVGIYDTSVTVLYEVRSGPGALGKSVSIK